MEQSRFAHLLTFALHQYIDVNPTSDDQTDSAPTARDRTARDRRIGKLAFRRALKMATPEQLNILLACAMIMQSGTVNTVIPKLRHGYKRNTGNPEAQAIIETAAAIAQTRTATPRRHNPRPAQPPVIDRGSRIEEEQIRAPRPVPNIARRILSDLTGYRGTTDPWQEDAEQARRDQYTDAGAWMPAADDTEPVTTHRRRILTRGADPTDKYEEVSDTHREGDVYDGGEDDTPLAPLSNPVCLTPGCNVELSINDLTHPRALCDDCAEDLEITRSRNAQQQGTPYKPLPRQSRDQTLFTWLDNLAQRPDRVQLLTAVYLNIGRNPHTEYTVNLGKTHRDSPDRWEQPQVTAQRALIAAWFYARSHGKNTPSRHQVATMNAIPTTRITHVRHLQTRIPNLNDDSITAAAHTIDPNTPSRHTKKNRNKKKRDTNVINYEEFYPTWKPVTAVQRAAHAQERERSYKAKHDPHCPTTKHIRALMDHARRAHRTQANTQATPAPVLKPTALPAAA